MITYLETGFYNLQTGPIWRAHSVSCFWQQRCNALLFTVRMCLVKKLALKHFKIIIFKKKAWRCRRPAFQVLYIHYIYVLYSMYILRINLFLSTEHSHILYNPSNSELVILGGIFPSQEYHWEIKETV